MRNKDTEYSGEHGEHGEACRAASLNAKRCTAISDESAGSCCRCHSTQPAMRCWSAVIDVKLDLAKALRACSEKEKMASQCTKK